MERGFINYTFLNAYDPFLDNLRREEAFQELMKHVRERWESFDARAARDKFGIATPFPAGTELLHIERLASSLLAARFVHVLGGSDVFDG